MLQKFIADGKTNNDLLQAEMIVHTFLASKDVEQPVYEMIVRIVDRMIIKGIFNEILLEYLITPMLHVRRMPLEVKERLLQMAISIPGYSVTPKDLQGSFLAMTDGIGYLPLEFLHEAHDFFMTSGLYRSEVRDNATYVLDFLEAHLMSKPGPVDIVHHGLRPLFMKAPELATAPFLPELIRKLDFVAAVATTGDPDLDVAYELRMSD